MKTVMEKPMNTARQITAELAFGTLGAFFASVILLCLFSLLMALQNMPSAAMVPFACVSISGGALCGGFVTARLCKKRGFLYGVATGLIFFVLLYLIGAMMRQADLNAMLILKIALSALFGGFGGVLGVNTGHRKSRI